MVSLEQRYLPAGADGALIAAAHKGDVEAAKRAVEAGASLTAPDSKYGFCALTWAAQEGQLGVAEYLLELGSAVDAACISGCTNGGQNLAGTTALARAARGGHFAVVSVLLSAGADVNVANGRGVTAV